MKYDRFMVSARKKYSTRRAPVRDRLFPHRVSKAITALLAFAAFLCMAGKAVDPEITRVQVICPSTPTTDTYTPVSFAARTGSQIDKNFTGDVWLWTDGPWIRPFHVRFTRADQGIITLPLRFNRPVLQRVEAYSLTGVIETWSNPVVPVDESFLGERLLWGAFGDCNRPGLDFCITYEDGGENLPKPVTLRAVLKKAGADTLLVLINPGLDRAAMEQLEKAIRGAKGRREFIELVKAHGQDVLLVTGTGSGGRFDSGPGPEGMKLTPGDEAGIEDAAPFLLRLGEAELDDIMGGHASGLPASRAAGLVPDDGGLIGAWCAGNDSVSVWRALRGGLCYASWRGRPIIDWRGNLPVPGNSSPGAKVFIAGEGPREEVAIINTEGGVVLSRATDDFSSMVHCGEATCAPGASHYIVLVEPGSDVRRWSIAGPIFGATKSPAP